VETIVNVDLEASFDISFSLLLSHCITTALLLDPYLDYLVLKDDDDDDDNESPSCDPASLATDGECRRSLYASLYCADTLGAGSSSAVTAFVHDITVST
jgi:hypothetical protein